MCQCWSTGKDFDISALCGHWVQFRELAMSDAHLGRKAKKFSRNPVLSAWIKDAAADDDDGSPSSSYLEVYLKEINNHSKDMLLQEIIIITEFTFPKSERKKF